MLHHLVAALVHWPVSTFELGCVVEIFGRRREHLGAGWYDFAVGALAPGSVESTGGLRFEVVHGLELFESAGTIIVPSWDSVSPAPPALLDMLRAARRRGARLLSLCTGAFLLAEAGILDGRRATTHWQYARDLQRRYPSIAVEVDALYIDEGDVITAAGSAASLDMLLHLVRRDHGTEICNAVARAINISPWRHGEQSQFAPRPVPPAGDCRLSEVIAWMRQHATEDLSIADLAQRAAMSPRTFFRRFRAATGETPYDWLITERVAIARELLETGRLSVEQVAFEAGFGAPEVLRVHFKRLVGCTPAEYRKHVVSRNCRDGDAMAA